MKIGLGTFGIAFGLLVILAAIFNWPIVVWGERTDPQHQPPDRPTIGSDGRRMPPWVRLIAGLVGAAFVVLGILTLAGKL